MYRYGDGTPFPLEENFIETITAAVESCTNAFMPLTELDGRRERARAGRQEADRELSRLADLEKALNGAVAPYNVPDRKGAQTQTVAAKILATAKDSIRLARTQVEGRVQALEAEAAAATAADAVLHALRPFFDHHQLPNTKWVMSWDVRGADARADAIATAGRLVARYRLGTDTMRNPLRVGDMADNVVVHMMKKGVFGKAKPAPVDLSRYVMVAFEKTQTEHVVTLKEKADRAAQGLRFMVSDNTATWQSMAATGDAETEPYPLDFEDIEGIRRLGDGAAKALSELMNHRTLVDLSLGGQALERLPEPRVVPMEVLQQLTPLSRTIRERSRVSGELVLKLDIGGGRREELFVPRAQLAQRFAKLPMEYRKPFEDMGVSSEDTQPAIMLPPQLRPPARPTGPPPPPGSPTIKVDPSLEDDDDDDDATAVDKK
jgi:hypothetical protein